jgi:predicted transcriptional regulator
LSEAELRSDSRERIKKKTCRSIADEAGEWDIVKWTSGLLDSVFESIYYEAPVTQDDLEHMICIFADQTISSQLIYTDDIMQALQQYEIFHRVNEMLTRSDQDLYVLVQSAVCDICTEALLQNSPEMWENRAMLWEEVEE